MQVQFLLIIVLFEKVYRLLLRDLRRRCLGDRDRERLRGDAGENERDL